MEENHELDLELLMDTAGYAVRCREQWQADTLFDAVSERYPERVKRWSGTYWYLDQERTCYTMVDYDGRDADDKPTFYDFGYMNYFSTEYAEEAGFTILEFEDIILADSNLEGVPVSVDELLGLIGCV